VSLIQAESQAGQLIEADKQLIQRCSEALTAKLIVAGDSKQTYGSRND